ncbi:MAG TPA: hypothetical protein VKF39_01070 [Nitrososphaerales archaeon]|nr:hypothetical protein [Nitrososphaerales archaeon]
MDVREQWEETFKLRKTKGTLLWRDVGRWWDTEGSGNISTMMTRGKPGGRIARINICQKEYEPLGKIAEFLTSKNVHCKIYPRRTQNTFSLEVYRQDDVRRFLRGIEPYVMTIHHQETIRKLTEFLERPSRSKPTRPSKKVVANAITS